MTQRVRADAGILELDLIRSIFSVHGFLLRSVGGSFTATLAALPEATEGKKAKENGASTGGTRIDSRLRALRKGVELFRNRRLFGLRNCQKLDLLR